jgi:hypothetical protein
MLIQLDFFHEKTEIELFQEEISLLKKSQDKLRKALFARHGELAKNYLDLKERLEIIERNICHNSTMKLNLKKQ